ncbi:MAG TPA: lycopene cyclase domain-containing protein [Frankiaceae bacterium]|nr:lycopene cyclase domain-containing protein [Frankiaceae bacterium]
MTYPALAAVGVVATLALEAVLRTGLLRRRAYWVAYAVVVAFQLLVNGVLTCRGIVTGYRTTLGPTVACAPVEDLAFGWAMVTQTLLWWTWLGRRERAAGR